MDSSLSDLLQRLAEVLPQYEPRPSQVEMAEKVGHALKNGRALVVEAGTGTGKTLAYLLPAAQSGMKVVVSTATKTLQEQLAEKDVPLLKKLGVDAKVAFLKGRQNYLCLLRYQRFRQNPTFATPAEAKLLDQIDDWAEKTQTGDRAELSAMPEGYATWKDLSSTADSCIGQKCEHAERCFVFRMRKEAQTADVIVVNHHLFFADLALRTSSAGDTGAAVLPKYDAVIFDEAHAVEEVATEHFGASLSSFRVSELARDALKALPNDERAARDLATRLMRDGADFFAAALTTAPPSKQQDQRWVLLPGSLAPAEEERRQLAETLRAFGAALSGKENEELQLLERRALNVSAELEIFSGSHKDEDLIQWAEARGGHLFLHASPVDIAQLLQDKLYDQIGPVVFTSATLSVNKGLGYFEERIGLRDETGPLFPLDSAVLESPFDYQRNAALYLPRHLPEPQDEGFVDAVCDEIRKLTPITGGRAFVLFTSLRNMRMAHEQLAGELPWQVLLQGDMPKQQLLRRFREEPSVLFASQSFWEGVDVQGDALSLVIIDKLPFASPSDPLVAARIDRLGPDAFFAYQVPQAALALKQGFGRLIRSATDRGIVAILDPRVSKKGYGRLFVESLPRCRIVRTPEEARAFWIDPDKG